MFAVNTLDDVSFCPNPNTPAPGIAIAAKEKYEEKKCIRFKKRTIGYLIWGREPRAEREPRESRELGAER